MKSILKLGLTGLAALALMSTASTGYAGKQQAVTSAPGINEVTGITASLNAPPNIATLAANQDPAGTFAFAPLAIPNPNSSTVTSKNEALSIGTQNENTGNTVAHYKAAPPTNTVNAMKTATTTLATNGTAPTDMVSSTHAPGAGLYGMAPGDAVFGLDTSPAAMQLG